LRRQRARCDRRRGDPRPRAAQPLPPPGHPAPPRQGDGRRMTHVAWRLLRRALVNLWRAPLPSLLAVVTIGLALFLGGALAFSVLGARALVDRWGAQASVTAYPGRSPSGGQARAAGGRLRGHPP